MNSAMTAKFRLVRCPKCREILVELPEVPVYECGGCGMRLQAKIRKTNANSPTPGLNEADAAQTNKLDHVSDDKESSSPSHKAVDSSGEHSLEKNNGKDQMVPNDCSEQLAMPNEEQNNGSDQNEFGDLDSDQLQLLSSSNENQRNGSDQNESVDCNSGQDGGINLPNEDENNNNDQSDSLDRNVEQLGISKEAHDENESADCDDVQVGGIKLLKEDQNNSNGQKESSNCIVEQLGILDEAQNQNESRDGNNEQLRGIHLSNEDQSNGSNLNEFSECNIEQPGISQKVCLSAELANLEKKEVSPLVEANSEVEVNDERSQENAKAHINNEIDSHFRRPNTEKMVNTMGSTPIVSAHRPTQESISSDILISSPNELLEQPQKIVHHCFDHQRSTDTLEATDFINPSSELSGTLIDLSKSPTTTSARAYYDDGISSYEGTDDQLPGRHKRSFRNGHKPAHSVPPVDKPRKEKFQVNSNSEMQHHLRNSVSVMSDKILRAMKSSELDRNELLETARLGHQVRNWRTLETDDYPYQLSSHQRASPAGYESDGLSNQFHSEFHCNSTFHTREKPSYTEQEKMKLLRMISDLQDQVNKACFMNEKPNERVSAGVTWKEHNPMYYDRKALEEERVYNFPRYPGRFREGRNWLQQTKYSRIPFSAEATTSRHHVDHSLCCCPQDWQCSAQLPPPGHHHNESFCMVHPHINFYNSYGSCPSSPLQHGESEFPMYSGGMNSGDQRHRDREIKKYLREKHHLAKRHLRPMAGGAPFVTCSFCFKQLQLPADFLLFKRRCHRLRCGACSEILKFSLLDRTHLVPYTPTAKAPPPSEVDERVDVLNRRNTASISRASDHLNVDSVSFSEDYGLSFCKSCSTDMDFLNAVDRNVPNGVHEHSREQKESVLNESRNKYKNPVETYESAKPSSSTSKAHKVSSEIEEVPAGGGSPLHRLMGYSSPSQVIYGSGPSTSRIS